MLTIPILVSPSEHSQSQSEKPVGTPASIARVMQRVTGGQIQQLPVNSESLKAALAAVGALRNAILDEVATQQGLVPETITVSFAVSSSGGVALFGTQANRESVATFELCLRMTEAPSDKATRENIR